MKTVMDIDWSKAPEGTTHWMPNGYEWSEAFLSISDSGKVKVFTGSVWYATGNQHSVHSLTKLGLKAKPSQPVFTQQKSVLMEESLKCIIDHLSECGISVSNDYHAPSIDDLHEPQQKAKWVAMNALDMLSIDTRTDKEKAAAEFVKDMTDSEFIRGQFEKAFLAGVEWVGE